MQPKSKYVVRQPGSPANERRERERLKKQKYRQRKAADARLAKISGFLQPGTPRGSLQPLPVQQPREAVDHPAHYNGHPSGIECIVVVEHMNFNCGNAVKYLWRADLKGGIEDLRKSAWYVQREIERREKASKK